MNDRKLLRTGLIGSIVAAVGCFTPLLVILVAGAGLSSVVGGLDYVLFPVLFASFGIVAYALYLRAGRPGASPKLAVIGAVVALSALVMVLEFRLALWISLAAAAAVAGYWFYLSQRADPAT